MSKTPADKKKSLMKKDFKKNADNVLAEMVMDHMIAIAKIIEGENPDVSRGSYILMSIRGEETDEYQVFTYKDTRVAKSLRDVLLRTRTGDTKVVQVGLPAEEG